MKGYLWTNDAGPKQTDGGKLARWESIAIEAVGNVIEFWGFKRNMGRVWALLYLRGEPFTAPEIEKELSLSKGGVSMLLRDLERWGVVHRVRAVGDAAWRYRAETDLVRMVSRVVEEREAGFISRIRADIAEARRLAEESGKVPKERLQRLAKMSTLADQTEKALKLFIRTSKLDVGGMFSVFQEKS
ncbi:MAG: GbsR/MarR family transcriptional regulator [Myxococcota bacterium]